MKSFFEEFKTFAMKGNVIDLAVAVVVGGAFGKITSSLVGDIIMPLIGILLGGVNFTGLKAQVGNATVTYGIFIQSVIDFLIIAFVVFLAVKLISKLKQEKKEEKKEEPKPTPEDIVLLREIRDLLQKQ